MVHSKINSPHYTGVGQAIKSQAAEITQIVPEAFAGLRLDQALTQMFPHYSRNRLQIWVREQRVRVDGQVFKVKDKVWGGETIRLFPASDPGATSSQGEAIALDIVYEDTDLIVINKPAGLVVHPGSGNWQGTLLNALLHYEPALSGIPRAGIVHRLDKETSGLLVIAKTIEAQTALVRQLQARSVKREYLALVHGIVEKEGSIQAPLGRHATQRTKMAVVAENKKGARKALTHYQIEKHYSGLSLLRCRLETGRTHQIRVHMHYLGHPLVGDPVYGLSKKSIPEKLQSVLGDFQRQALHAQRLALAHPRTGEVMEWQAKLPDDFAALLNRLSRSKSA